MNITWLNIGTADPNYGEKWTAAYRNWIGDVPARQQYAATMPTAVIYGCPTCGWVQESATPLTTCDKGHRNPYFVRFGEHEREVAEAAVTAWQARWQEANAPAPT